jgi:hypothetical protein
MGVSRSVIHTNFDRAVKRYVLTYHAPVGVAFQSGAPPGSICEILCMMKSSKEGPLSVKEGPLLRSCATGPQLLLGLFYLA